MSLPTDDKARKDIPLWTGFFKYFPRAIAAIAELSRISNEQHNPGTPVHWDRSKSPSELDSAMRHLADMARLGEDSKDTDGVYHATKAAWRLNAFLEKLLEKQQSIPTQQNLWWAKLEGSEGWLGETKDDKVVLWSSDLMTPLSWNTSPYVGLDGTCKDYPECEICGDKVPDQQYAYEDTGDYQTVYARDICLCYLCQAKRAGVL